MEQITASLTEAHHALRNMSVTDAAIRSSADSALLEAVESAGTLIHEVESLQSRLASEVAHRSRPELGHSGLAARRGSVNAVSLVASLTRSGRAGVAKLIRVGDILAESAASPQFADGEPLDPSSQPAASAMPSAFGPLAEAVLDGRLGVEAADRVTRTLAPVIHDVDPQLLNDAVAILGAEAGTRHADDLTTWREGCETPSIESV